MFPSHHHNVTVTAAPHWQQHALFDAHPIYYSPAPSLLPALSDPLLTVLAPLPAYWLTSGLFQLLDLSSAPWLTRHRIHDSAEVAARNRASRLEVFGAVVFQQALQTALALAWVDEPLARANHPQAVRGIAQALLALLSPLLGLGALDGAGAADAAAASMTVVAPLAYVLYWWAIPAARLLLAMVVLDTWQYFLHRLMHQSRFLYKHLHSVHHRLYVPYAYGALYNHPIEGFLLDTLGALLSETVAGLSIRQAMFFFILSTCKTVDDHCGYSLPFDPLQWLSGNTADYHDIHHQVIGIKSNFSQPWFIHWDVLLGTRMTRQDIEDRRAKYKSS